MISKKINLQLFSYTDYGTSDFFNQAFQEANEETSNNSESGYNIDTDTSSEGVEATESGSSEEVDEIPTDTIETQPEVVQADTSNTLTREEMLEAIRATQEKPELDEETKQAIELMNYLKENPQLVEAMRGIDPQAHQDLTSYVPDEMRTKIQQFEEFMIEQQYQQVVNDMKSKYEDYDAEKVLEYAEAHELTDLEIAYKALKAETAPKLDIEAEKARLREELKKELMEELKQTVSDTSTIVTSNGSVPPVQKESVLSHQEQKVAEAMGLSKEEYAKWRDGK